ncbi:hypothetical protein [Rhizobium binae]|nr:hypothetical protein [Rhizobium binae]
MNHRLDDRVTIRSLIEDIIAAIAAGAFVAAVSIWLPYIAQHH